MPDPIDQNTPPAAPPQTLPDPQAMVDAALNTPSTTAPTTPTPAEPSAAAPAPGSVPTPPTTPPPEPVLDPLPPTPSPLTPPPSTTNVAMGDDTPLAFVTPPPSTSTTAPTASAPVDGPAPLPPVAPAPAESVQPKGKSKAGKIVGLLLGFFALLGMGGYGAYWYYYDYRTIPLVAPVTQIGDRPVDEESDCHGCDGGHELIWRNGQCVWKARLCEGEDDGSGGDSGPSNGVNNSGVTNRADCDGCATDGYSWVWRDGACKKSNTKCSISGGNYVPPVPEEKGAPSTCNTSNGNTCCGAGYTYCGVGINKCVSHAALSDVGGGCNKYGEVVYGIATVYGASAFQGSCDAGKVTSGLQTECSCGNAGTTCFERRGICFLGGDGGTITASDYANNPNVVTRSADGSQVNMGLCGLVSSLNSSGTITTNQDFFDNADCFECTNSGCSLKANAPAKCSGQTGCTTVRYTCDGTVTGNSCTNTSSTYVQNSIKTGSSLSFEGKCGTVEQIDVMCGGKYIASRTSINPECNETDNPPASEPPASAPPGTPVMACTGLTQVPAAPAVGDKVTFTCTGTITPATAGTLSYKFRYSINNAAPTAMVNKTATTTELNIAACGEYKVECQTCATIAGVLKCDPNWVGATQ